MARYKGNYKDLFKDTATYTVDLKETKTVIGESNSNFQAGMDLTVNSGKLIIKADTLDETTTQWYDVDWKKWDQGWKTTKSYLGANINLYGAFFLSTANTHSIAAVIVSNGKSKWRNTNLIQILYGEVEHADAHKSKVNAAGTKVLTGVRFIREVNSFWNTKATRLL